MNYELYMRRCIELAKKGSGKVSPNPMVGSVIVYNHKIIGEGWHREYGKAHAEVNAINSVEDKSLLSKATIYVSLEPCAHYGKTPPCADLIIKNKIPNVIIGTTDSFDQVNGKGIERLKENGISVELGILETDCKDLNKRFFTYHQKKRPYIILKWAQTEDGFLDRNRTDNSQGPNWITGETSKTLVHKWRSEEDAILIGTNTALNDNPSLTTRNLDGKNPIRLVIDKELKIGSNSPLYSGESETIIFTQEERPSPSTIILKKLEFQNAVIPQILDYCHERQIQSLIVEGGAKLLNQFIENDLWDEARVFTGKTQFKEGLKAPTIKTTHTHEALVGKDILKTYYKL